MATKAKILDAIRQHLNQYGLAASSTRDMATAAGMRQGNLTYHFARRELIVEALYDEFIAQIDQAFAQALAPPLTLGKLYQAQLAQGELQQRYRFLFLDFAAIRQAHPRIDQHFQQLMQGRRQGFGLLIGALQQGGILLSDLSDDRLDMLFEQFIVLGNFWPHAAAVFRPQDQAAYQHYARLTLGLLCPYLTEQGEEEWSQLDSVA